jgi:hypothetical protein
MNHMLLVLALAAASPMVAQTIQLGYDLRHSIDPQHYERNFVTASFEVFKPLEYGSLLMKVDADLSGRNNSLGKLYVQLSHALRFWSFPVFLHLEYSGGIGFVGETENAYHIFNTFSAGAAYGFRLMDSWASTFLAYRYTTFDRPSHDVAASFWWGKDLHPRISVTAYVVLWTVNQNRGDAWTQHLRGKRLSGLGEPQIWFNISEPFAVGSELRLYYQVYDYSDDLLIYPTIAVKYEF